MHWHVQRFDEAGEAAPFALLVHGAGASTHSWRDLAPLLAPHFRLLIIDLPGHAFTATPGFYRPTLPRVARLVGDLLARLDVQPTLVVGHSAGAAILARMVLDGSIEPRAVVSINGAFAPFDGAAGHIFPALAKLLFVNPLTPRLFALSGRDKRRVVKLIEGTGSSIDQAGLDLYHTLMMSPGHIAGVLAMMANWDLGKLGRELPALDVPLLLLTGSLDRAVPPRVSRALAQTIRDAEYSEISGLGHLAHEEDPDAIAAEILAFAHRCGVLQVRPPSD